MSLPGAGGDLGSNQAMQHMAVRLRRLGWAVAVGFLVVLFACWYHQVVRADYYGLMAERNRLRVLRLDPARGLILDREGRILAENVASFQLMFNRSASADLDASLAFAAATADRDEAELRHALQRNRGVAFDVPVLLAEDLELSEVARFEVAVPEHPEFEIAIGRRRLYRHSEQVAHVVGYLGAHTPAEQRRSGSPAGADLVGRSGVEQLRDRALRGRPGQRTVVVDSRGRQVTGGDVQRTDAEPGDSVRLTLDLPLQQQAETLLAGRTGAIVALDPADGAVRAMASAPSFDPNRFVRRLDQEDWKRMVNDPGRPLQNRSMQNAYPPGSVFKIAVALGLLTEGRVAPGDTVHCGGSVNIFGRRWRCWEPGGHGRVDLRRALQHSCDIYFYRQGLNLGIEKIARYARLLGLGSRTGIGLAGETGGLVPDQEWSRNRRGTPWYSGETISVAIGQGPLLASPLQVAVMTAAIANGGHLVHPHVLEGDARPAEPLGLDPEAVAFLRDALANVVTNGTGSRAASSVVPVAGKTGTAQVVSQETWIRSEDLPEGQGDHAWFTSFAPVDAPQLVVVVFLEHGGSGSRAAAPLARRLHESWFDAVDET